MQQTAWSNEKQRSCVHFLERTTIAFAFRRVRDSSLAESAQSKSCLLPRIDNRNVWVSGWIWVNVGMHSDIYKSIWFKLKSLQFKRISLCCQNILSQTWVQIWMKFSVLPQSVGLLKLTQSYFAEIQSKQENSGDVILLNIHWTSLCVRTLVNRFVSNLTWNDWMTLMFTQGQRVRE